MTSAEVVTADFAHFNGAHSVVENGSCIWRKTFINPNGDGFDWFLDLDFQTNVEWGIAMYREDYADYWLMVWSEQPVECTGPVGGPYDDSPTPYAYVT